MQHPAEREAERLRIILTTLAESMPDMELGIAAPIIFETEKKTAELERQQVETAGIFMLPNSKPETIAAFIELQPDIADLCVDKKINAIKEVRSRAGADGTFIGLKEAKEGVEWFVSGGHFAVPTTSASPPGAWNPTFTTAEAVEWVDLQPEITDAYDSPGFSGGPNKIQAIKECRAMTTLGLTEAKDLVEAWARMYR